MTEQGEQRICIKFCIKLEHSSRETIRMIQKAATMGNWWLEASLLQCSCLCTISHAQFLLKQHITQVTLQYRYCALRLLVFPKTKIAIEREEFSDHWWESEKYDETVDSNWENCVRSQGAYSEGDWGVIVLCTMFLVSGIFFSKCLYLPCNMAGYLLDRPHIWS